MKKKSIIIIPTYNEATNIEAIIKQIFALPLDVDILVVDDSSPDGTYKIVQKLIEKFRDKLYLLINKDKKGLANAYIKGFKYALNLNKSYDYFVEMDADFSHNPKYIKSFLNYILDFDIVIGSRYIKGGRVNNWSLQRKIISYFGNIYAQAVLGIDIKDTTSGFKCFKREVLESIDLSSIITDGYAFQIEMNYKAYLKGYKIKEIPIAFIDRVVGDSKMSSRIFFEAFFKILLLRIKTTK